jgi:hypothetical protein
LVSTEDVSAKTHFAATTWILPKAICHAVKTSLFKGCGDSKDAYRQLQIGGEQHLYTETDSAASSFTINTLKVLNIARLRQQRETNSIEFLNLFMTKHILDCEPLFSSWPSGAVPFNSILICKTKKFEKSCVSF